MWQVYIGSSFSIIPQHWWKHCTLVLAVDSVAHHATLVWLKRNVSSSNSLVNNSVPKMDRFLRLCLWYSTRCTQLHKQGASAFPFLGPLQLMVIHLVFCAYTSQTVSNQMAPKRHVLVLGSKSIACLLEMPFYTDLCISCIHFSLHCGYHQYFSAISLTYWTMLVTD